MTLPEALIAAGGIALVLAIAALGIAGIRTELKHRRTAELLVTLDASLEAYHKSTSQWPGTPAAMTPAAPAVVPSASSDPAEPIIAALGDVAASREALKRIPAELRISPEEAGSASGAAPPTQPAWGSVQDAWGRRLHCLTASSPAQVDRQAVAANGGKPIFVSAGENGEFWNKEGAEAADNLRSDELAR